MTILILIAIGLGAGVLSGLLGIGGGIVIVPALIYFAKFQPQQAAGTSLGVLVIPVGAAIGALTYYKAGHLDVKASLIIAAGLAVGAAIGSHFGSNMDAALLKKAFAVLMVVAAAKMWVG
ncbi:MAG: sulfite exporter TauE/SafE family protein [Gemmatimonadaceae bacterium]|nr:sulfite exporter TauE/SafE family protein [Gemmatimonadaceae bacterium]